MLRVTGYHAKRPHMVFEGDTLAKQRAATAREHEMADSFVRPLYDRLEALREQVADQNDKPSTGGEIDAL
jgi:hypothetical protein